MYVDHASVVALAKHDLVMQAFAYQTDSGSHGRFGDSSLRDDLREEPRADPAGQPSAQDVEQASTVHWPDMEYPNYSGDGQAGDLATSGTRTGSTHGQSRRRRSIFTDGG